MNVRCMHHGWHGTHRYDIQILATHAPTYSSLLQLSVLLVMVLSVGESFAYFARNARCTVTTDLLCDIPTNKTTSPPERPFYHCVHSHRLAAEMWTTMKNNLLGEKFLSCSFYLYRFRKYVSYGFPIINFCNPGVHYETPCIIHPSCQTVSPISVFYINTKNIDSVLILLKFNWWYTNENFWQPLF
jgi:hypothetical protein